MVNLTYEVLTYHNTTDKSKLETIIDDLNNNVWSKLVDWAGRFDFIFDFSKLGLTQRTIILVRNSENKVVGYASIAVFDEGVVESFYEERHFPTIKLYLEGYKSKRSKFLDDRDNKKIQFTKNLFDFIFEKFGKVFLLDADDYPVYGYHLINDIHCLPITNLYTEGLGYLVYPRMVFNNVPWKLIENYKDEYDEEKDEAEYELRSEAMSVIISETYPFFNTDKTKYPAYNKKDWIDMQC